MRVLRAEQVVPVGVEEAWAFFSDARNLAKLMPPHMALTLVDVDEGPVHEGQIIVFRVKLGPMVWAPWVSEITRVVDGREFVDDQRVGPYAFWHHRHVVEPAPGGDGTLLKDIVRYHVGYGPIGSMMEALFIDRMVDGIFEHRKRAMDELFPAE